MQNKRFRLKLYLAVVWLLLTSSFIVWWMYFALSLIAKFTPEHQSYRTMLIAEGVTMLALLVLGGATLVYLINLENRQRQQLADFFSTFSHDVKTALASLRLQAESLQEDIQEESSKNLVGRLVADTSRLLVRIENSLFLGQQEPLKLLPERLSTQELQEEIQSSWPQVKIVFTGESQVFVDRRSLLSILQNLVHNAISHGSARTVTIHVGVQGNRQVIKVADDGSGFSGNTEKLGRRFFRHSTSSGSGLGLSIVSDLVKQLRGRGPEYNSDAQSFSVQFDLPMGRGDA